MIGKTLAHYEITALLGKGGMGEVYRAHDTKLEREVALKVLPGDIGKDSERRARFAREARTLASLQHANVASVYGFEDTGGIQFLVMELVDGEDLASRLERGPIAIDDAVEIALRVATGLDAAHEQGIVHRDLKPANIQLATDGEVKILDFGLARAMAGDSGVDTDPAASPTITAAMTQAGTILGTAAYMSPEQARGKSVDRRADIWAFGVVLYEMLAGRRLFEEETTSDTLAAVLRAEVDLDSLPDSVPAPLRAVIHRCLERDPRQRLRDVGEARLALEALRSDVGGGTILLSGMMSADSTSHEANSSSNARERLAWGVTILAAIFGIWALVGQVEPPKKVRWLSLALEEDSNIYASHRGLVISPDGEHVAYVQNQTLRIRALDSWEPLEIPESMGAALPFWSPDSQWVAYVMDDKIWKVRTDGSQRGTIGRDESPLSAASGGAWLEDGRIVYRGVSDLMVVSAAGGVPKTFLSAESIGITDFHDPTAMPEGSGLVVVLHDQEGQGDLAFVGLDGSHRVVLSMPDSEITTPCYSPSGHLLFVKRGELMAASFQPGDDSVGGEAFTVLRDVTIPSVSNTGTLLYLRGDTNELRQLVLVDRQGRTQVRLGKPQELWPAYTLSYDGQRAVVGAIDDLFLHDRRGAMMRTSFTELEHDMPAFSPDGRYLYFSTGTQSNYSIGRKLTDSNAPEETVIPAGEWSPHYYASCPVLTADGERLFYTSRGKGGDQDIAWLDMEGDGVPQVLVSGAAREFSARPAPHDAEFVAYVSDESGIEQVYLTTWPDAAIKVAVSIDGGTWPRWKRDGSEIYYARNDEIYAVSVSYDPLVLGKPELLFQRPEDDGRQPFGWPALYDVTAEGELFLTTERVDYDDRAEQIAVVENWASTIRE